MDIVNPRRKRTKITLDPKLFSDAKAEGINLSRVCEAGLAAELKKVREQRWLEENRDAIEAWRVWTENNELPLAKYRLF